MTAPSREGLGFGSSRPASWAVGDVTWFPAPPNDLHSQQGLSEAAWELVYFGRDPLAAPRLYFDPESGTVEERAAV